jgi:Mg2+ and Co2+ transporter CorA
MLERPASAGLFICGGAGIYSKFNEILIISRRIQMFTNTLLKSSVLSSVLLLSGPLLAQNGMAPGPMMYGQPPVPAMQQGQYPAPPAMSPEVMQRRMEARQKKMQEMHAKHQSERQAQKQEMRSQQQAERQAHRQEMMKQKQEHMKRVEERLANIEKLMQEMLNLMKAQ